MEFKIESMEFTPCVKSFLNSKLPEYRPLKWGCLYGYENAPQNPPNGNLRYTFRAASHIRLNPYTYLDANFSSLAHL